MRILIEIFSGQFLIIVTLQSKITAISIYQAIYEAKLDTKLEKILLKLLEHNSTVNVQEPIRQFLFNFQIMSDNFWERYTRSNSYEEVLECYYQFAKNQCVVTETLLENLRFTLNKDNTNEELANMLRDGFTF